MPVITYQSSTIHYLRLGYGSQIAVFLHGFGQSCRSIEAVMPYIQVDYTCIAIDLPFHGETEWLEERALRAMDMEHIIAAILKQEELHNHNHFTLAAYSIGARIALATYELIPSSIDRMVLWAPDGIRDNYWYKLATRSWLGKRLFQNAINHPEWLMQLSQLATTLKIYPHNVSLQVRYVFTDEKRRVSLYNRWMCFSECRPDMQNIINNISHNNAKLRIAIGKDDPLIPAKAIKTFCKKNNQHCELLELNTGHVLITSQFAGELARQLLDN